MMVNYLNINKLPYYLPFSRRLAWIAALLMGIFLGKLQTGAVEAVSEEMLFALDVKPILATSASLATGMILRKSKVAST